MARANRLQQRREAGWALSVPEGKLGAIVLPGQRTVWWTGRVAIGLLYEKPADDAARAGEPPARGPEPH